MGTAARRRSREARAAAIDADAAGSSVKRDTKGKRRADAPLLWARDEGSGGEGGVVLDMTLVGDQIWDPIYTVPVTVGAANQTFSVQVDTGSSDLWIASKGCSSQACTSNKPKLYDPSSSTSAGQNFNIQYLSGQVTGPIVWDSVVLGPYQVDNQALAAATTVVNESLSSQYSGILGLALPLDSVIAGDIPPDTSNAPDGATVASNIFGITPAEDAPGQLFFSLLLERPNSARVPSLLGIGMHPTSASLGNGGGSADGALTIDPSQVAYSTLIPESNGVHFWKVELRALTVYVNGTAQTIDIGQSVSGSVFPQAVLDTGVPYIIATPSIANAVWGALGISPGQDGNYYIPCSTPLNMTVTLDDRSEIPIHPLDLTGVPSDNPSSSMCVGLLQQDSYLESFNGGIADIILGVPFLRNVYTVLAYELASSSGTIAGANDKRVNIDPQLGLLSITNATTAMQEFNKVRLLNQPLDGSDSTPTSSEHGLPVGLKVLFGLVGFIGFCAVLFAGWWFYFRHRLRNTGPGSTDSFENRDSKEGIALHAYEGLAPYRPHSQVPSEDTQRTLHDPTMDRFSRLDAKYNSLHTKVESTSSDELGFLAAGKKLDDEPWEGPPALGDDGREPHASWIDAYSEYQVPLHGEWRPSDAPPPSLAQHGRTYSASSVHSTTSPSASAAAPLLADSTGGGGGGGGTMSPSATLVNFSPPPPLPMPLERQIDEFGIIDGVGMIGIGTAHRGSSIDGELTRDLLRRSRQSEGEALPASPPPPPPPLARPQSARRPAGPRRSSTMSNVVNANDMLS